MAGHDIIDLEVKGPTWVGVLLGVLSGVLLGGGGRHATSGGGPSRKRAALPPRIRLLRGATL